MNIPQSIFDKIGRDLHNKKDNPIEIIKNMIYSIPEFRTFAKFDNLSPLVHIKNNFDNLLIPPDHPARAMSDTYYINHNMVLRTQTSAHQYPLLARTHTHFLVTGDVYRKDQVNSTHYPVFHQMEGVCLTDNPEVELKKLLVKIVDTLFPGYEYRINDDYFPFTHPSYEVEVYYNDDWLEILGCGVIQQKILDSTGHKGRPGWAFGLGLDRLAMILFNIPDIRYMWLEDKLFLDQFSNGTITPFIPYSTISPVTRDISFWIDGLNENDNWDN